MKNSEYLTGIRGLAVLIVLLGHISNTGSHPTGMDLHGTAKAGVWLFFVLSAYLLTKKLLDDLASQPVHEAIVRYAIRRVFRIMPTYLVFLGGLWGLSLADGSSVFKHALLLRGDEHLWTIPVEMKFYVVLPICALAISSVRSDRRIIVAATILSLSFIPYVLADPAEIAKNSIHLTNYGPMFAAGIVLALSSGRSCFASWAGLVSIVIMTPRVLSAMTGISFAEALNWSWALGVSWSLVIYGAQTGFFNTVLTAKPLIYLGNVSFSLYLVHYPTVLWISKMGAPSSLRGIVMLFASILIACVLHRMVELPARDFGYRVTRRKSSGPRFKSAGPDQANYACSAKSSGRH